MKKSKSGSKEEKETPPRSRSMRESRIRVIFHARWRAPTKHSMVDPSEMI